MTSNETAPEPGTGPLPAQPSRRIAAWWRAHLVIAARRWVESGLIPLVIFFSVRPAGLTIALASSTMWQLGVALYRHRRHAGGIAALAVISSSCRLVVALISSTALIWLPVFSGVIVGVGLLSGRLTNPMAKDLALDVPDSVASNITRLWGVEQTLLAGANALLASLVGIDAVMLFRPVLGAVGGGCALMLTIRLLNRHIPDTN